MLLFVLSNDFRELPEQPEPSSEELRADARALLASGLFLTLWCTLRLLAAKGEGFSDDAALATAFLGLGVGTVLHAVRSSPAWR